MELFALFFLIGTILAFLAIPFRVWMWFAGQDLNEVWHAFLSALKEKKVALLKGLLSGTLLKAKLRSADRFSGTFKALFLLSYLGIIIGYHLKVDSLIQLQGFSFFSKIFYAPFADFYFFQGIDVQSFKATAGLYGVINDTFESVMILFVIYLFYKLLFRKRLQSRLTADDLYSHLIVALWFLTRFLAEVTTLLAYKVPPEISRYWYVGSTLSQLIERINLPWQTIAGVLWPLAGLFLGIYIASIPWTKLWHIFVGPIQIVRKYVANDDEGSLRGRELSKPFDLLKLMESENLDIKIGATGIEDFDWKKRISLDACMKCGRCQEACPAHASGRNLSPAMVVQNLKKAMRDHFMKKLLRQSNSEELIGGRIHEDTVWACTTCYACIQACPVDILQPEFLIDFRRKLVAHNKIDDLKMAALANFSEKSNPYGLPRVDRDSWTKGWEVPRLKDNGDVEYLYWVGCAASYDSRNQKTAKSLVRIFNEAKVSFAILGKEENCCGETLRRMGDEGRYQEIVYGNVELLKKYRVKKIIIHCPHGYNTFKNEYPRFGGNFEVIHHSDFILSLIKEGRIKPEREVVQQVAFHDPCYLGRYNGKYVAPREILKGVPGVTLKEPPRSREDSFCCGGGGGNAWYEVPQKEGMSTLRIAELERIGVDTIGVACPYCLSMLEDAVKVKGFEKRITIRDIAEVVAQSLAAR